MKPKVKVTAASLKKTISEIRKFGNEADLVIDEATDLAAKQIATEAKMKVNSYGKNIVDFVGEITSQKEGEMYYTISADNVPLAAYAEFGTGAYVEVADEWRNLAWQFYKNGLGTMTPHPYLYPTYTRGKKIYEDNLKALLDQLTKKHSK